MTRGWVSIYIVLFSLSLMWLPPSAQADSFVEQWRSCHLGCSIVSDQCLFLNGVDTCEGSRLACKADCDVAYPTMNVCVDYCDVRLSYCADKPARSTQACGRDNRTCLAGCEGRVAARLP